MTRLDALLSTAAKLYPERPALAAEGRTWTYAELEQLVEELSWQLSAAGIRTGDRIGVYAGKGSSAVMAIYAGLRAGAVVAPMDVADPPARTARMVHNAGLSVLLTVDRSLGACREAAELATEGVDLGSGELDCGLNWVRTIAEADRPEALPAPTDQGGYILFTSGSTGWPKGVLLSHENVAHYALWAAEEFGLTERDRIGSQAALTFDLTTFDLYSAASAGACAVLMPDVLRAFPRDVVNWLNDNQITAFMAVPSLYHNMLLQGGFAESVPPTLRVAAFGGEAFAPRHLERYLELLGDVPFYNLYGPTETNACTYYRMPADWTAEQELTIGRGIGGVTIEVLDEDGRPTDGEGEIVVGGPTVFQGYLERGVLRDPTALVAFRDGSVQRAYFSGDIGRITADGLVYLRGRRDSQVKRRGHRIDLLDVESAVLELPGVATAAVVAKQGEHSGQFWAYVQTGSTEAEVLTALGAALPKRMLPDRVVVLPSLPTTTSGKVDRRALGGEFPAAPTTTSTEEIPV
ncbi:hypothetical protein GCM10010174_60650 [Kutzneria viridogrisea]|uniref:Amino acid adenylation domain-containing protein n=2 Tax=Kutzneria TaxID=43356 RepID=W5W2X2_9PSEU|nr:amino acid adenylation domain-containing protein [Kutzneria albida]AHH95548.1 hypothetical protein KALB_2179 [Kutzneria albida DSM 43870]MBA8927090.1 amino acid adenylation domain-containing protein [Kutzneria viridogrisea]